MIIYGRVFLILLKVELIIIFLIQLEEIISKIGSIFMGGRDTEVVLCNIILIIRLGMGIQ